MAMTAEQVRAGFDEITARVVKLEFVAKTYSATLTENSQKLNEILPKVESEISQCKANLMKQSEN